MVDYRPGAKKIREEAGTFMVSEKGCFERTQKPTLRTAYWQELKQFKKKEKIMLDYSPQNKICMDSY